MPIDPYHLTAVKEQEMYSCSTAYICTVFYDDDLGCAQ